MQVINSVNRYVITQNTGMTEAIPVLPYMSISMRSINRGLYNLDEIKKSVLLINRSVYRPLRAAAKYPIGVVHYCTGGYTISMRSKNQYY